jgi:YihY family inner membrane protein
MNPIERNLRRADTLQRGHRVLAVTFAVNKKFGDDTAGNLAALITYYGFLSLFPLMLVLVTVLGLAIGGNAHLIDRVEHSALSEFPVFGSKIGENIHALKRDSAFGLVVGVLGLVWGSQGIVQTGQLAMANVWNVPRVDRPGFLPRLGRSGAMLGVAAVFLIASTAAAGFASFAPSFAKSVPGVVGALSIVVSLILNLVLYVLAFRILTPKLIETRQLILGALIGGALWTVLQNVGTLLLEHQFKGASALYGTFAIVLGLMAWIFLGARITLYCAELNVVLARHLWPRSLMQPPLTEADQQVYAALALQARQRRELAVDVSYSAPEAPQPDTAAPDAEPDAAGPQPAGGGS